MCGFAGVYKTQEPVYEDVLYTMAGLLNHRGPDGQGVWVNNNMGLAHARLSIHDLTQAGSQPMLSYSGRWVIAFNGEIYNYKSLRSELAHTFHIDSASDSDTEVLVNAIELWGIEKALQKTVGMFALACWDRQTQQMYLARDRFGEKPLYYGFLQNDFVFGSELKCLQAYDSSSLHVDRDVLASYMRFGYVPTPYSIYQNVYKLEPGTYLTIDCRHNVAINHYWQAKEVLQNRDSFKGNYIQAIDKLESQLKATLDLQMESDVPLGAFLSGGFDSSLIVALMQSLSTNKVQTFSIGFDQQQYNEAEYAKAIAEYLGTDHTNMYVSEQQALDIVPKLPNLYSEPFADSSQIPTHLVSQVAKSKVTVGLSGDGGDELFGGYNRYLLAGTVKNKILDKPLSKLGLMYCPMVLLLSLGRLMPARYSLMTDKLIKLKSIIQYSPSSQVGLYETLCSQAYRPNDLVLRGVEPDIFQKRDLLNLGLTYEEWMMFVDSQTYMMDDILTKVDRAAMGVSLETRIPFLDHRIFDLAWSLPLRYKVNDGQGKSLLRDLAYRYIPRSMLDRPKKGFSVPLAYWLRGPLKEWACELLNNQKIKQQGFLNIDLVSQYWREHQSGKRNWHYTLWSVLMFQAWLEQSSCVN